jgi:hypothetical protein
MSMSSKLGELFEDLDFHPVVCLTTSGDSLFMVSLVDGSCRRRNPKDVDRLKALTIADAITWRFSGPISGKDLVNKPWWKRNKGIDPVGSRYEAFPASLPINGHAEFRPGDFYEGSFHHPCICLWIIEERKTIAGISLVRGNHPKTVDLLYEFAPRLTPREAWTWRTEGPQEGSWPGAASREDMIADLIETDEGHPAWRWWGRVEITS